MDSHQGHIYECNLQFAPEGFYILTDSDMKQVQMVIKTLKSQKEDVDKYMWPVEADKNMHTFKTGELTADYTVEGNIQTDNTEGAPLILSFNVQENLSGKHFYTGNKPISSNNTLKFRIALSSDGRVEKVLESPYVAMNQTSSDGKSWSCSKKNRFTTSVYL
jgi:hypothetical protein